VLTRLRPRSVYDALAVIALVVLVAGGSAYAAATIGVGALKDDAVRSRHIKDGAVQNADLGADSVGTGKVIDGSLTRSDIKPAELPRPTGADAPHHLSFNPPPNAFYEPTIMAKGALTLKARCVTDAAGAVNLTVRLVSTERVTATTSTDAEGPGRYGRAGTARTPTDAVIIDIASTGPFRSSPYWYGGAPVSFISDSTAIDGILSYGVNTPYKCEVSFFGG
jgi:hypothetical protein